MDRVKIHLLILLVLSSIITFITQNIIINDQLFFEHFSDQMSASRIYEILEIKNQWLWLNYVLTPALYLVKFYLISFWILCATILLGYKNNFKEIFRVVVAAEYLWLVPSALSLIWFGFIDTSYSFSDVQYFKPLSLLSFFDPTHVESWLIYPLQSLNLFELAYMFILAIGIKRILKRDYNAALNFTVPVYGSALFTWIIFVTFINLNMAS